MVVILCVDFKAFNSQILYIFDVHMKDNLLTWCQESFITPTNSNLFFFHKLLNLVLRYPLLRHLLSSH